MEQGIFLYGTAAIYNIATVYFVYRCLSAMNLKRMLKEKRLKPPINANAAPDAVGVNPAKPALVAQPEEGPAGGDSYSRITGCVGAIVLTTFIWALGNAVIYKSYIDPGAVKDILSGVAPFILSGSALFAPYAFNQLSTLFPKSE